MFNGNNEVYRGEMWFVEFRGGNWGSEQDSGRPAIVVSNDMGNKHSNTVEVVYLTTQEKKPLPTHVDVMCRIPSVALCEQVHSVSKERLMEYVRTCTAKEMQEIDKALLISLGLTEPTDEIQRLKATAPAYDSKDIVRLITERDLCKQQYEQLLERLLER